MLLLPMKATQWTGGTSKCASCSMLLLSYCESLFTHMPIKYRLLDGKILEVVLVIIALAQSTQEIFIL